MKVISVANRKGGVGKTTTALNIAYEMSRKKFKVLVLDLDDQCDTTKILLEEVKEENIQGVLEGTLAIDDVIYEVYDNLDAVSGSREIIYLNERRRLTDLGASLEKLEEEYDYVIIDHPPSISEGSLQGFIASDEVLIVTDVEAFAIENLHDMLEDLTTICYSVNKNLSILGIIANKVDLRRKLSKVKLEELRMIMGNDFFETYVSYDSGIPTSHNQKVPVRNISWKSKTATQFSKIVNEILERLGDA